METHSNQGNADTRTQWTSEGEMARNPQEGRVKLMQTFSRILVFLAIITMVLAIIAVFVSEGFLGLESWAWSLLSINFAAVGFAMCNCTSQEPGQGYHMLLSTRPGGPDR